MQDSQDPTSPALANLAASLPPSVRISLSDGSDATNKVLVVTLARAHKRNALDDVTVLGLAAVFDTLPSTVRAVVLQGEGEHFSAGLDLSELIGEAIDGMRASISSRAQTLRLDVAPPPMPINGDHVRLVQVVNNLLSNASKYTPRDGEISMRCSGGC